jgi:cytochrome c553
MNKLLTMLFALAVASATVHAQAPAAGAAAPAAPSAAPAAGGAKSLQAKVAMCIGCHGIPGYQASFPEIHKVPMISGQSAKYIAAALNAYGTGERKHPTMRGISQSLTEQDINDIAAYYEAHGRDDGAKPLAEAPTRPATGKIAELVQKGNCAACHGANFSKPIDPSYPKIGGQHADYMFVALKSYKTENNSAIGRNNAVMGAIAKQFSNAELKALANYMASLEGDLKVVPESKFR